MAPESNEHVPRPASRRRRSTGRRRRHVRRLRGTWKRLRRQQIRPGKRHADSNCLRTAHDDDDCHGG
eukprot:1136422-Pelagomonas_calceolata.AAC.2